MAGSDLPTISVVVPVRNMAGSLPELLDSLQALDYPSDRLEVLVVDNGSTDGGGRIARERGAEVLDLPSPPSSYAARNAGWRRARGEWIAFTDADCRVEPAWLRGFALHDGDARAGAVAGEVLGAGDETVISRLMDRHGFMQHRVTLPHKALPGASTACLAVRRTVLERLGGFRGELRHFGDMDFCWRMQLESDWQLRYEPRAVVRHHHRRTWKALVKQGIAHGRGVAFMKRTYPALYRFRGGEQAGRAAGLLRSLAAIPFPAAMPFRDRIAEPLFLAAWYGGMAAGYVMGPALVRRAR